MNLKPNFIQKDKNNSKNNDNGVNGNKEKTILPEYFNYNETIIPEHNHHSNLNQSTTSDYKQWCKVSYISLLVAFIMFVTIILMPVVEKSIHAELFISSSRKNYVCEDTCNIQLVESIPDGLNYTKDSPKFLSTYNAWLKLLNLANTTLDIASFYWTLRNIDVYNHTTSWEGEKIFEKILSSGTNDGLQIRIAQNIPKPKERSDIDYLMEKNAANIRFVDFKRLLNGGVLHTKLWIADDKHFYLGSANMDWRSLTQVKELGVLVTNCTCLAKDISKIFNIYWYLGRNDSSIPKYWPKEYTTKFNENSPIRVNYNDGGYAMNTFFSSSPPPMTSEGRTNDLDAIINTIMNAKKFVYISVMDYFPLTIYTPKIKYWPYIDDAIRKATIDNRVEIKLLISFWNHSHPSENNFLKSIQSLSDSYKGVNVQVKRFIVPANDDQAKIPFARVNHNKYMVTDNTAYIGTSNWSGDYFINTAGIGFVFKDIKSKLESNQTEINEATIRTQLVSIFERDWNSEYAFEI